MGVRPRAMAKVVKKMIQWAFRGILQEAGARA